MLQKWVFATQPSPPDIGMLVSWCNVYSEKAALEARLAGAGVRWGAFPLLAPLLIITDLKKSSWLQYVMILWAPAQLCGPQKTSLFISDVDLVALKTNAILFFSSLVKYYFEEQKTSKHLQRKRWHWHSLTIAAPEEPCWLYYGVYTKIQKDNAEWLLVLYRRLLMLMSQSLRGRMTPTWYDIPHSPTRFPT